MSSPARSTRSNSSTRHPFDRAQAQISAWVTEPLDPGRSYSAQIHRLLRGAIVRGHLPPGAVLSEAAIAAAVGASRTPVREALQHLVQEQLVQVYPQVGTHVAPLRVGLIREGCFVRRSLECANLLDAVKDLTNAQRGEMRALLSRLQTARREGDAEAVFQLDEDMHRRLFEFAGRSRVWSLIAGTKLHLDRVRWLLLDHIAGHADRICREHAELVRRLVANDTRALQAAMQAHIDAVAEHLLELRRCLPENYFSD
jgi:DNA-binding GntR family transcriptional regulator